MHQEATSDEVTDPILVQLELRDRRHTEMQSTPAIGRAQSRGVTCGTSIGSERIPGTVLQLLRALHHSMAYPTVSETRMPSVGGSGGGLELWGSPRNH